MHQTLLQLRIEQIARQLQQMVNRRKRERRHDCAIIFTPYPRDAAALDAVPADQIRRRDPEGKELKRPHGVPTGFDPDEDGIELCDRFVQFAFMKDLFYLDLPNETLLRSEAWRLLGEREAFFRVRDRRWWFMSLAEWKQLVRDFDPIDKEYGNWDARGAAEDTAFILYDLWNIPLDVPLHFNALLFGRGRRPWEGTGQAL